MKRQLLSLLFIVFIALTSSCGGGSTDWTDLSYDVSPDATLNNVLDEIAALSGGG